MATGEQTIEVKVSVEKLLHDVLRKTLQKIWDEEGICITDICIKWRDESCIGKPSDLVVTDLRMETLTKERNK